MGKIRVFISSVQKEFVEERKSLYKHFSDNALLNNFFEPVMFEKLVAASKAPDKVYLKEVENSQLYLMMLGAEYGYEDKNGLSPTEIEYNYAQSLNKKTLYQAGYIERYGTGTGEIFRLTKEAGLKEPVFSLEEGFKVIVWRIQKVIDQDISQATDQATDQAEDLIKRLVIVLDKESGRGEIMNLLDLRHGQNFRENYLFPALKLGYIKMTLPDKPTSPKQRYRLTEKGKALKKMLED
jgi:Filamentation induced by cAMP protein Fic-like, C-terminal domain/Domain of unknown function (DUF4062)